MINGQYLDSIRDLIAERIEVFNRTNSITNRNSLPADGGYPQTDNYWYKINGVICVFVDMRNSTKLSINSHDNSTASIFDLFSGTAVRIFHEFGASFIDIKGDGVFALFNPNQVFRSLAAAVTFKTFAAEQFKPLAKRASNDEVDLGFHMGIDQKVVMVKQVGLKDAEGRDSRKNEVWAGKPVNMASKLASLSQDNELWVSDRYYANLKEEELVVKSCGCSNGQQTPNKIKIWDPIDVSDKSFFDFKQAHILKTSWCPKHGKKWCEDILKLD